MNARSLWTIDTCPACDGSGWDWCLKCAGHCEHDRICARCHGHGQVPVKLDGFDAVASALLGGLAFPSRRAALLWLDSTD